MITVTPYFDTEPAILAPSRLFKKKYKTKSNPNGSDLISLLLAQRHQHLFDERIYGAEGVKSMLERIFHKKCAFCECNISIGAHYDVEHFRSKRYYYWLGYEWTNLLLACHKCNRDYKQTKFPLEVESNRVLVPPLDAAQILDKKQCHILSNGLMAEQTLLLHPAIDNPRQHLQFLKNGQVIGLTVKGVTSIEVYGLNREELVRYRRNLVHKIRLFILYPFELKEKVTVEELKYRIQEAILVKILGRIERSESTFIGFTKAILEHFDEFIIENTDEGLIMPYQQMMKEVAFDLIYGDRNFFPKK
jgi:hypothetical protein